MFEVEDLNHASPATVSRCGMIYFAEDVIGIKALYESWKLSNRVNYESFISELSIIFEKNFDVNLYSKLMTIKLQNHLLFIP